VQGFFTAQRPTFNLCILEPNTRMSYPTVREEELKAKVAADYFWLYDCTRIIGNVDFCVQAHQSGPALFERESLLWAEAKTGKSNLYYSLAQLILTIGKARTFDKHLPPPFLGAFDSERIAFVPYGEVSEIFYINDFNWNVTPSSHTTREFGIVLEKVKSILDREALIYAFGADDRELRRFIRQNLAESKRGIQKTRIDKNNFMVIYNKWLAAVKPSIAVNWDMAKKSGIIDGDFYLADLLSQDNETLKEKLFVLLHHDHYELDRQVNAAGLFSSSRTDFNDRQVAHTQFWNRYHRPPREEYWDYIVERRDLLVPQDVRERKGSFFTPQQWVALSQQYLADVLGEDWQDEYYVWDCAAGTGNLAAGLTNKYNIWASTLDKADVEVMRDRIKNGANLLESHVFQFDFLNDDFSRLPAPLQEIINDEAKRKKLVVYINPPYAEGDNRIGQGRRDIQVSRIHDQYSPSLEDANRELFAQFLIRIYYELDGCKIAEFSKLKTLTGAHFKTFRRSFKASLEKAFLVPAWSFDNVKGKFPIGFKIWDTDVKIEFEEVTAEVFNENAETIGHKVISSYSGSEYFSKWVNSIKTTGTTYLAWLARVTLNDFQSNNTISLLNRKDQLALVRGIELNNANLIPGCVCFAVRHCIEATWLNDRDQFLFPAESWKDDTWFHSDCLAFTLFHSQNRISTAEGVNHWIPFTEAQVDAKEKFESNFMSRYLAGKGGAASSGGRMSLFVDEGPVSYGAHPTSFSSAAQSVYDAGLVLWRYYHAQPGVDVNASLYDIRAHFQGRNESGKMNNKSTDEGYNERIAALRAALRVLADKIAPKVYEHGFLKM
jgi:hypothetical protein